MGVAIITVGCKTSSGGTVMQGSPFDSIDGQAISCVGHKATCPLPGHGGLVTIVQGDPTFTIDGQAVARHGDLLSCGCSLIGNQTRGVVGGTPTYSPSPLVFPTYNEHTHDRTFLLQDPAGNPLPSTKYKAVVNGKEILGTTDETGHTERLKYSEGHPVELHILKSDSKNDKSK